MRISRAGSEECDPRAIDDSSRRRRRCHDRNALSKHIGVGAGVMMVASTRRKCGVEDKFLLKQGRKMTYRP